MIDGNPNARAVSFFLDGNDPDSLPLVGDGLLPRRHRRQAEAEGGRARSRSSARRTTAAATGRRSTR